MRSKKVTKLESSGQSVIGRTLTLKGEISADEDLLVEGTVEGTIAHQEHQLTVGKHGRVTANVHARVITVEGWVRGDLNGDEAVRLTASADVAGNICAPRVAIDDGASFEGMVRTAAAPTVAVAADPATSSSLADTDLREAG